MSTWLNWVFQPAYPPDGPPLKAVITITAVEPGFAPQHHGPHWYIKMNAFPKVCLPVFGFMLIISPVVSHAQWVQTSGPYSLNPIALLSVAVSGDTIFTGGYQGDGIYRSFDGGDHWIEIAAGDTYSYVNTLLIRNNVVYAGNYSGVYHSTDYGESWLKNQTGLPERADINSLAFLNDYLFAASELGVFKSSDGGENWVSVNVGLPGGSCGSILSVTAANTTIFAGTYGGVYRSTNYGLSWISSSSGLTMGFYGCPARVNTMMVMGNILFAGTDGYGMYRSDNNGQSWDSVNTGLPPGYNPGFYMSVRSLEFFHDTIFAGLDGGSISISADSGAHWETLVSGLPSFAYVFDFAVGENNIYAATFDGLYQSNGIDTIWNLIFSRYPEPLVARRMGVSNNNLIISGWSHSWNGSIPNTYYTSDRGDVWYEIDSLSPVREFNCFASGDSFLLAGSDRIYRSTDDGNHWTEVDSSPGSSPINSIFIKEDTIYTATGGYWWQFGEWGGVYKSTDGARNWSLIGLRGTMVTSLTIVGDIIIAGGSSSIYRSDDNGNSWNRSDSGFAYSWGLHSLLTVQNHVIAWVSDGIYLSIDSGRHWSARNNGLPFDTTNTTRIYHAEENRKKKIVAGVLTSLLRRLKPKS